MKKRIGIIGLLIAAAVLAISGCAGMTANQLEAEKAYYAMLAARSGGPQPLVDIKISDPTKPVNIERITVYAPPSDKAPSQYVQTNYDAAAWQFAGQLVSIAAPWAGAYYITKSFADMTKAGTTTYNQNMNGSNNVATVKTAGNTAVSGGIPGSGNVVSGLYDQTGTPTVVTAPDPVIVTQPPPVIVQTAP